MHRRTALLLGIGAAATTPSLGVTSAPQSASLLYYAPLDSRVEEISDTTEIDAGAPLFRLHSPQLQRDEHRIQALQKLVSVLEKPLFDGHVDSTIALLPADVQVAAL